MRLRHVCCLAILAIVCVVCAGGTLATCAVPHSISSVTQSGYSYLGTSGVCPNFSYPCPGGGSSVTNDARSVFWIIGAGDPAVGAGVDNGTLPALQGISGGLLYAYPGYAAFILADWADPRTDGCPNSTVPTRCMAIALSDQVDGVGYSAFLTTAESSFGDYDFVQPGEASIFLLPMQQPSIVGSFRLSPFEVSITLSSPSATGLYYDSACFPPVTGYHVYELSVPQGSQPPVDRGIENWNRIPGAEFGFGVNAQVVVECDEPVDTYLAYTIVTESGFETQHVSRNSNRVECGPNLAEPTQRPRPFLGIGTDGIRARGGKRGGR